MRTTLATILLLALPAFAGEQPSIAARMPAGATAYFEVDGLAERADRFFASPLYKAVRDHPTTQKFLASPEGQKVMFGQGMLQGMIGLDVRGLFRELGKGRLDGCTDSAAAMPGVIDDLEAARCPSL